MTEFYNHHYIRVDATGNIIEGWSDGPNNTRIPTEDDILLNNEGGYQFRLIIDGADTEENPLLYEGVSMIPLYRWTGTEVVQRSEDEIEADRAVIRAAQERQAEILALKDKLSATDYAVIKIAEGAATAEEYAAIIEQRKAWREKINELESGDEAVE